MCARKRVELEISAPDPMQFFNENFNYCNNRPDQTAQHVIVSVYACVCVCV